MSLIYLLNGIAAIRWISRVAVSFSFRMSHLHFLFHYSTISIDIIPDIGYNIFTMHSTKEAAEKLGLSQDHVRLLSRTGILKAKKLGHDWIVLSLDYKRKRKPGGGRKK